MKKLFFLLLTTLYACYGYAQTTGYIRNDTVKITNATKTATLILETASKGHNWYLKDVGNGRTQFVQAEISDINQLQDSLNTKANNNNVVHLNGYTQQNVQGILAPQRISMFGGVAPDLGGISTSGVAIGSASADRARVITTYTGSVPQWSFGGDATDHNWLLSRYVNGVLQDSPISVGRGDGNINYGNHTGTWVTGSNSTVITPGVINVTGAVYSAINIGDGTRYSSTIEHKGFGIYDGLSNNFTTYNQNVIIRFGPGQTYRQVLYFPDLSANSDVYFPTGTGTLALSNQVLSLTGGTITGDVQYNVAPVNATSLINKSYVDNAITGITWKSAVRVKTTANITLSGTQTIDGIAVVAGNRVLVNNQTDAKQNGIYVVASGTWTRPADADSGDEIATATVAVTLGTLNKNTQWTNIDNYVPVIGTDNIDFGQISGAGTYTNGSGIDLSGNVFSLNTAYARGLFSATSPLTYNSVTGVFGIQQASGSQDGYLSSTDWGTFNGKQNPATTLGGYGITDAYTKTQIDALTTGGANPSATIGLTATNGTATTFMRSDAAPALSQSITPTWTGLHTYLFNNIQTTSTDAVLLQNNQPATSGTTVQYSPSFGLTGTAWDATSSVSRTQNLRMELRTTSVGGFSGHVFVIKSQVGTSGYTDKLTITQDGYMTINTGRLTIGAATAMPAQLDISGNLTTGAVFGTSGLGIRQDAAIYTSTGSSGTITNTGINTIGIPTLAASSATTLTTASTFRIAGAPVAGTNATITNPYAFEIVAGNSLFGGNIVPSTSNALTVGNISTDYLQVFTRNISTAVSSATLSMWGGVNSRGGQIDLIGGTASTLPGTIQFRTGTGSGSAAQTVMGAWFSSGNLALQNGGTYTDDGVNRLQIGGSIKASQFRLSALNTAPSSSTDTGTLGEVRITAGYFYLCTATNTWVRSAFSSF